MSKFDDFKARKIDAYGSRFDTSELAPQFIPYYNEGWRIEVETPDGTLRGRVGVSTGWKPFFLLMLTARSRSSRIVLTKDCKVVRVISYRPA